MRPELLSTLCVAGFSPGVWNSRVHCPGGYSSSGIWEAGGLVGDGHHPVWVPGGLCAVLWRHSRGAVWTSHHRWGLKGRKWTSICGWLVWLDQFAGVYGVPLATKRVSFVFVCFFPRELTEALFETAPYRTDSAQYIVFAILWRSGVVVFIFLAVNFILRIVHYKLPTMHSKFECTCDVHSFYYDLLPYTTVQCSHVFPKEKK